MSAVHTVMSTRGPFMVCDVCFSHLKEGKMIDVRGRAAVDTISEEFCINCFDRNKVLIDDLAGSTE